ncbi:MAG: hypothetical protein K6G88_05400 [Lachnospiraceae bacterium]|nr:hypothetical protein [Lachnospiraceae bacterium]
MAKAKKLPQKRQIELYVPTDEEVKTVINHFRDNNDKDIVIAIYLDTKLDTKKKEPLKIRTL